MAQITEEIRARFPRIICQHQLIEGEFACLDLLPDDGKCSAAFD